MRSYLVLLFVICTAYSSKGQKVYVYFDVAPEWHEQSYIYWQDTKAYNQKVKDQAVETIKSNSKQLNYDFYLSLKEELHKQSISLISVDNPTTLSLADGDTYLEAIINLEESEEDFPFYYRNRMAGPVKINLELIFYDALGKSRYEETIPVVLDLKQDIWSEITSRTKHDQAIEGFNLIMEKIASENMDKISDQIITNGVELTGINNSLFHQEIVIRYERKKADLPNHYASLEINRSFKPLVKNQSFSQASSSGVENAAYDNPSIANKLATALRSVNNYGLFIGVNQYQDPKINDLDNPINDAQTLQQVLIDYYTFQPENITFLENPTRAEIIRQLDNLARIIDENSNLLIFYAGHGLWDEQLEKGYWIPSDGAQNSRANWLSNNDLVDYVGGIKSKHTLLITDACFSGSIFKTRDIFTGVTKATLEMYKYPSKKAMTSGAMKSVPDKSVFLEYLVKRLIENKNPFLSSEELFSSFKNAVVNNSPNNQIPQFGVIQGAGDEGGDFIFILK